jgi:hypothetical protein
MGRRARVRYRCKCAHCLGIDRTKLIKRFEAKLVEEALLPDEENIFDSWYDWEKHYDLPG